MVGVVRELAERERGTGSRARFGTDASDLIHVIWGDWPGFFPPDSLDTYTLTASSQKRMSGLEQAYTAPEGTKSR